MISYIQYKEAGRVFTNCGQILLGSTLANYILGNSDLLLFASGILLTLILIIVGLKFWKKSSIEECLSNQ
jgi:hypothetical protein